MNESRPNESGAKRWAAFSYCRFKWLRCVRSCALLRRDLSDALRDGTRRRHKDDNSFRLDLHVLLVSPAWGRSFAGVARTRSGNSPGCGALGGTRMVLHVSKISLHVHYWSYLYVALHVARTHISPGLCCVAAGALRASAAGKKGATGAGHFMRP